MISKKTKKADLEKKRPLFFEIGLTIALAMMFVAFEWTSLEKPRTNFRSYMDDSFIEELEIDITRIEKKEELKKPKAIQIEIIKNETDIPESDFELNTEINEYDGIIFPDFTPEEEHIEEEVFVIVENMPEYRNGGLINFHDHIMHIVDYPQTAIELGLEGTVYVSFVINKKGKITKIKIVRSVDPLLDNAAIAAIEQSEKWKPGIQAGRPVNVAMVIPVRFRLQ